MQVHFFDRDRHALHCAETAAEKACVTNGDGRFYSEELDWLDPCTASRHEGTFDVVLASDILYELENRAPLSTLMRQLLQPNGRLITTLPIESEYRPTNQASVQAAEDCLAVLSGAGFLIETTQQTSGVQLPGEGPLRG